MTEIFYVLFYMLSLQTPVCIDTDCTSQFGLVPFQVLNTHVWFPHWACAGLDRTCHPYLTNLIAESKEQNCFFDRCWLGLLLAKPFGKSLFFSRFN